WIGGMGVLVFVLAFLPKNNEHTMYIMRAEVPGPTISKLVSRLKTTAMILYGLYMALSVIELIFLLAGGMPLFDSLCNTFGTAGTGGFAIYGASIGAYHSVYVDAVITVFMFLFGVNFNMYFFLILRDIRPIFRNEELRWYFGIVFGAIVLVTINILGMYESVPEAVRYASFQVVSIITTTGYATADFNLWPTLSKMILFFLMVVGACAGSTGGGIKVTRLMIVLKKIKLNIQKLWHPHKVEAIMVDGKIVNKETVDQIMAFFGAWMIIIAAATLIVALDNFDFTTTLTSVYTCLGNVGPGLGLCGPSGSFAMFSGLSKIVLSVC
ncbi:MAG TPA: potassium transporter KefA, partial [Erysipelotrichaceae bacterium]|nr:potassium transporter KefA [Erysipelotrichaceae bacterium]